MERVDGMGGMRVVRVVEKEPVRPVQGRASTVDRDAYGGFRGVGYNWSWWAVEKVRKALEEARFEEVYEVAETLDEEVGVSGVYVKVHRYEGVEVEVGPSREEALKVERLAEEIASRVPPEKIERLVLEGYRDDILDELGLEGDARELAERAIKGGYEVAALLLACKKACDRKAYLRVLNVVTVGSDNRAPATLNRIPPLPP